MKAVRALVVLFALAVVIPGLFLFGNLRHIFDRSDTIETSMASMRLFISEFEQGEWIPALYTCDGSNVSPELSWENPPEGTHSFALIMDDPDVPRELKSDGVFDHWTLFNIPASVRSIPKAGTAGVAGLNGAGRSAYTGPCPPKEYEPSQHRYFFRLYALDAMLPLEEGATKDLVLRAMEGHVLGSAELMGVYKRK